ncbi:MAG: HAD-IC family P-type ATPase, partial [Actinomycetes bacterium]
AMVLEDLLEQGGLGVAATVNGTRVTVGRPEHLVAEGLGLNALGAAVDSQRELGRAVVAAGWDREVRLVAGMSDSLREGAAQAVEAIKSLGARPVLLTGDSRAAAEVVAAQLGISEVRAEVLPAGKSSAVSEIQATGKRVAMAGDGINDTPALVAADLGIAVGGGADAAVEAADLALLRPDPRLIADSILLSRKALSTIRWNLAWAFGYNVAALPLAVAGLLQPIIASAAMAFSSLFVIGNALRLRRFKGITPAIGAVGASPARDRQRDPRS